MASKRPHTPPSSSPRTPSPQDQHPFKATRTDAPSSGFDEATTTTGQPIFCTLPPTCNAPSRPTPLANTKELETHYATYHAHVCEDRGCGCVFPDARLLELHQTECHDPLAAVRKDRGEKIFACHLATCPKLFLSPKARRLHLIEAHGYPKEYFFAVTNKGVGGLLKKWGEGVSMIRKPWKARAANGQEGEEGDEDQEDSDDDGEEKVEDEGNGVQYASRRAQPSNGVTEPLSPSVIIEDDYDDEPIRTNGHDPSDDVLDSVTKSMGSLSLVPSNIQFGRGAKRGGFTHHNPHHDPHHHHHQQQHHPHPHHATNRTDVDHPPSRAHRGGRGRGRGRGANPNLIALPVPAPAVTNNVSRAPPPVMPRGLGMRGMGRAGFQRGRGRAGGPVGRGGHGAPISILTRDRAP